MIVGEGSKLENLKDVARKKDLNNVFFMGSFPLKEMPRFTNFSDALLISLKAEEIFNLTIPNKLQSYFASGKPIIGSLNGEGAEIIKNSGAGLVAQAENSLLLAEKCISMSMMNAEEIKDMEEKSLSFFKKNFSDQMFINRLKKHTKKLF